MPLRLWLCLLSLFGHLTTTAAAEEGAARFLQAQAAAGVASLANSRVLWDTEGDLNGDGLADYAAVLSRPLDDGSEEERVVVLAATEQGAYLMMSLSGAFCGVGRSGKFYQLSVTGRSLFVSGVWSAEGENYVGFTLQFRYNQQLDDLQLIGEENESRWARQVSRASFNYLTGNVLLRREGGKKRKEIAAQLSKAPLFRLQDFECFSQDALKPSVHIDEHFKVQRQ